MSTDRLGGYADLRELEADVAAAEAAWRAPRHLQSSLEQLPPDRTYDVGIDCPRDGLQRRLDAARLRRR